MASEERAARTPQNEVILRTVDEGGKLTLTAQRTPNGWTQFTLTVDETATAEKLGEEVTGGAYEFFKTLGPANTWKAALGLLDDQLWEILHPVYVHPEFQQMVISAIRERAADPNHALAEFVDDWLPEWERACSAN